MMQRDRSPVNIITGRNPNDLLSDRLTARRCLKYYVEYPGSPGAERNWQRQENDQAYFGERYRGNFRRQIQLGDGLDLEHLEADLHDGVLTVRIPVAEQAKPRKVEAGQNRSTAPDAIEASTADVS